MSSLSTVHWQLGTALSIAVDISERPSCSLAQNAKRKPKATRVYPLLSVHGVIAGQRLEHVKSAVSPLL